VTFTAVTAFRACLIVIDAIPRVKSTTSVVRRTARQNTEVRWPPRRGVPAPSEGRFHPDGPGHGPCFRRVLGLDGNRDRSDVWQARRGAWWTRDGVWGWICVGGGLGVVFFELPRCGWRKSFPCWSGFRACFVASGGWVGGGGAWLLVWFGGGVLVGLESCSGAMWPVGWVVGAGCVCCLRTQ
jgi:hypothetical protein